ncbi:hypothetical protein BOX15_Mlig032089g2, partial [Macrostomum lignano]
EQVLQQLSLSLSVSLLRACLSALILKPKQQTEMAKCCQLMPCFPLRVIRAFSAKDRSLYCLFHVLLWCGLVAFFACLSLYAVEREYVYFIVPLPSIFLMFAGLFGFRWLAIRNNDKFELHHRRRGHRRGVAGDDGESGSVPHGSFPPPPPLYALEYDGPVFTIYGVLVPPPTYEEVQEVAAAAAASAADQPHPPAALASTEETPITKALTT